MDKKKEVDFIKMKNVDGWKVIDGPATIEALKRIRKGKKDEKNK